MSAVAKLLRSLADRPGPTHVLGLMRIGIIALEWARYARNYELFRDSRPEVMALSTAFFAFSALGFFGLVTPVAMAGNAVVMVLTYYYLGFGLDFEPYTHHHTHLLMVFAVVMALTPCGRSFSVDRWLALRRAERLGQPPPEQQGNLWALRLLALQVATIYFWGAWDKVQWPFLSGERMEHHALSMYFGSAYPSWPLFHEAMVAAAWGTVVLELYLAVALFVPRLRKGAIFMGIVFHALLYWWLPVGVFSLTMWLSYLAFVRPETVRDVLQRLVGPPERAA